MNRYYKNFILCGDIDQYCILCEETFTLILEIEKHIRWEKHRKNLKDLTCVPKFREDSIYKIKNNNNYYCETCNLVTFNIRSMVQHTKSETHKLLKSDPGAVIKKPVGQVISGYVLINKVILSKEQWNSVLNNKCFICNIDVQNEEIDDHINKSFKHKVALIQSETKYADNQYFRKINDDTYHCFICKKVFTATVFPSHWATCENSDEIEIKKLKEAKQNSSLAALTGDKCRMVNLEKGLVEALKGLFTIDEVNNVAHCHGCTSPIPIDFRIMMEHMKEKHSLMFANYESSSEESAEPEVVFRETPDNGLKRAELKAYGKAKHIKLNYNGSKGYCTICDKYISANIKLFRQHSRGPIHRGHLEVMGLKRPKNHFSSVKYEYRSILPYLVNIQYSPEMQAILINYEFCMEVNSFLLLYMIPKNPHYRKTKCYLCNEVFNQGDERDHCLKPSHISKFTSVQFITKTAEFIREVRKNLFHCGYCNVVLPFIDLLEKHVKTSKHWKFKNACRSATNIVDLQRGLNATILEITTIEELYTQLMRYAYG